MMGSNTGNYCIAIPMSSPALLFACPICLDALVQPVLATCCGQSFCDVCLREALAKTDACPLCREPLLSGPHSATRNRALEELLARLPVSTEHEVLLEIQSEVDATSDDQTAPIGRRWLGIAAVAVRARQYLWCLRWCDLAPVNLARPRDRY